MVDEEVNSVVSADGTVVGFEREGSGPPLVLVHGGTADRSRWAPVRAELSAAFSLYLVDRRGRGLSTRETADYAIGREGEDIVAVLDAIGDPAFVVGHSYGALVSIEAALRSSSIARLLLYEPAAATPGHVPVEERVLDAFEATLGSGDRDAALELFFSEVVGVPKEAIDNMRGTPIWQARLAAIHTALREGRAANAFSLDPDRLRALRVPTTILMGDQSPAWLRSAAEHAHQAIGGSDLVVLEGQGHMAIDTAPDLFVAHVRALTTKVE